jgi:hypothetical protein
VFSETSVLARATRYKVPEDIYNWYRHRKTPEDSILRPSKVAIAVHESTKSTIHYDTLIKYVQYRVSSLVPQQRLPTADVPLALSFRTVPVPQPQPSASKPSSATLSIRLSRRRSLRNLNCNEVKCPHSEHKDVS